MPFLRGLNLQDNAAKPYYGGRYSSHGVAGASANSAGRTNPTGPRKRTISASDKAAAVKSDRGRRQPQKQAAGEERMANEQ